MSSCLRSCRCPDCLLYAGVVEYAEYIEWCMLIERERRGRQRDDSAGHVSRPFYSPPGAAPAPVPREAASDWEKAGKTRSGYDTRCKCEGRPLPMIVWLGYRLPLERWCFHCGRVLPRPFDRKFLPVKGRNVRPPEVVEAAELVGVA